MDADHLHHFSVRAALRSSSGRLVCVDLADCLICWPAGRAGVLHLIPFNAGQAASVLGGMGVPGRLLTAMLIAHVPEHGPDSSLDAIATLADSCGETLFGVGDRLDGVTGAADLLLMHDG